MKTRYRVLAVCAFLAILFMIIAPLNALITKVYLDTTNGRIRTVHSYLGGLYKTESLHDSSFTALVKKYDLEAEPNWVSTIINGYDLFGNFHTCAYTGRGHLLRTYKDFRGIILPLSTIDNPTTVIQEMRRLAVIDNGSSVSEFLQSFVVD